jgi:transposase-like protein
MPLFAVERDLSQMAPEQFRFNLQSLVGACARLQGLGKKVRYISSAVFPSEARGFCLFGAEEPQWIQEVNEAARLPYSRIYAVLDLTPTGVRRDLSRGRWPARIETAPPPAREGMLNGGPSALGSLRQTAEPTRWSEEVHQLMQVLGGWLEEAGRLQVEASTLERERAAVADEVCRLEQENAALRAERHALSEALQKIADQTVRTVDELLRRIHGRRGAPGDLAER